MKTPIDYILNLSKEEFKFLLSTYKEQKNNFNRTYIKKSDTNVDLEKLVAQGLLIPTFNKEYYMGPMAIEAMKLYNQMVYLYINYDKVEDNPVPPMIFSEKELNFLKVTIHDIDVCMLNAKYQDVYYSLLIKLSGRETDKEQPITYCDNPYEYNNRKGPYCRMTKGMCKCYSSIPKGKVELAKIYKK